MLPGGGRMATELDFEKPITELRTKIEELRAFMAQSSIDLSHEVVKLEERLETLSQTIYQELTPWQRVQLARLPGRPTSLDYINGICTDFVELHGDRNFGDDGAIVGGIGLIDGHPVTVVGTQKGRDTKENISRNFGMGHPEGYRKALRLIKQAEKFGRPVLLLIDTAGAHPEPASEERGISEAIAVSLREMAGLRVPTVSFITGEGGSGGAIALALSDRVYMLEYAWYSVITPESAASILWKDSTQGARAADSMKITAPDVYALGVVDGVIPEPRGGAHRDPQQMVATVKVQAVRAIAELSQLPIDELLSARYHKYREMGTYTER